MIKLLHSTQAPSASFVLASHRFLQLAGDNIALISDCSTGWCILKKSEYAQLVSYLSAGDVAIPVAKSGVYRTFKSLWDSGLLIVNGSSHPETVPTPESYPDAILLKLTGACNFECAYCYDYDEHRFNAKLDIKRIKEIISDLLSKQTSISISFHGGEPLLRFSLLKEIVAFSLQEAGTSDRVRFSVQTNASLISEEAVCFFERYNFSVGISIDGANEESNALRVVKGSTTAWNHAESIIKKYPDFVRERCGFLAVASRTSAPHLPDLAMWLQDKGISGLSLSFLDLTGRGKDLIDEALSPQEAVDIYRQFVLMIRDGRIQNLAFKSLLSRIDNLFTFQPRSLCHKGPCGAASEFLVLDAEGSLRTCDCIYDKFFELGDQHDLIPDNSQHGARIAIGQRHEWLRKFGEKCSSCSIFGLCGGTCVAKAISHNGHHQSVDPIECAIALYLYPELLQEFSDNGSMPLFQYYRRHMQNSR